MDHLANLLDLRAKAPLSINPKLISADQARVLGKPIPGTIRSGKWKRLTPSMVVPKQFTHYRDLRVKKVVHPTFEIRWDFNDAPADASEDDKWWGLCSTSILFNVKDGTFTVGQWSHKGFTNPDQALDRRHYTVPLEMTPSGPRTKICHGGVPALMDFLRGKTTIADSGRWGEWALICETPNGVERVSASKCYF